jgi:CubicO group peptidase (beta-lactamase class C family)
VDELATEVDRIAAEGGFSGVVRVDRDGAQSFGRAYGLADRAHGVAATMETRFGIASGNKGLTALTVVSLIEEGALDLTTTARSVLRDDLPLIRDDVTVEHLLGHRSGIGDYLDEDADGDVNDYMMTVPVQNLATTEQFLQVLDGFPTKFAPDERFSYCNGGFMVLALIAERVSGTPFHDLVEQRVFVPAGMYDTRFDRTDELDGNMAIGYLHDDGLRTNALHLPVRGNGDGGAYTTAADVMALWTALFEGRIVSREWVARMTTPRSDAPEQGLRYGLGFWLHATNDAVMLEGFDAGVSFRTEHRPSTATTFTVMSNTSGGAWPIVRYLDGALISTP